MVLLIGDVGGTKTRLALMEEGESRKILREEQFVSGEFSSFLEIVKQFLALQPEKISKACFGIAGPVVGESCSTTNLPWTIEAKDIRNEIATAHVRLLNDLEAHAYGLRCLEESEWKVLQMGSSDVPGNQALIAAGTGLGEAGLFWDGKDHHPFSCEGGHTDFAPRDEMEMELLRYLKKKFEHVSYERVLSGPGLYHLYRFLIDLRLETSSDAVTQALAGGDPPAVISELALSKQNRACERALNWFVSLYGAEAGNLALKFLARGGLYLGGGIAPKILPALESGTFLKAFLDKGRFTSLLSKIPVKVVLNQDTCLFGCAIFSQQTA